MAGIEPVIKISDLKTNRLKAQDKPGPIYSLRYQPRFDALLALLLEPQEETVVCYADDHVGLVYEADSLEIVGIQIEAFEHTFLSQHEGVERAWRLSNTGARIEDLGDLMLAFEKGKPQMAEVVKGVVEATSEVLGDVPQAEELMAAVL